MKPNYECAYCGEHVFGPKCDCRKPFETPVNQTNAKWIKDRDEAIENYITKDRTVSTFLESEELGFREGADFGRSYEARKVEGLIAALETTAKLWKTIPGKGTLQAVEALDIINQALTNYESTRDKADKGDENEL